MTVTETRTVEVVPLTGFIGAEIRNVDLSRPLAPDVVAQIRAAWLRWGVVFFRDQHLDNAQHLRFARYFGQPTATTIVESDGDWGEPGFPQIFPFRYSYSDKPGPRAPEDQKFHADGTAYVNPPAGAIVRVDVTRPYGGDTTFANLVAAYAGLPRSLREMVDKLRAVHRLSWHLFSWHRSGVNDDLRRTLAASPREAIHPVVRVHPETGEKGLYIHPVFTDEIVGFTARQSQYVLDMLFEEIEKPEYSVRFRWEPGSIAFWDNRAVLHRAPADLRDLGHQADDRVLYHISLLGDIPVGPDGTPSTAVVGAAGTAADR